MARLTSYNGWPASSNPSLIDVVPFEPIPGHPFPGGVRAGDVHTVFTYLVLALDARVEPIERYAPGDEWGYVFKPSANSPSLLSCHSSGTAIDYNATLHPNGRRGTWSTAQVAEIRRILRELDGTVRWLYDATRTPDEMHFEIRATPYTLALTAARLRRTPTPTAPTAPTDPGELTMDAEARAAFAALTERLNDLAAGVVTGVAAVYELDDDLPENGVDILRELRVNARTAIDGLNDLRARQTPPLPPLPIVTGYVKGVPRYAPGTAPA